MKTRTLIAVSALTLGACATTQGARPHDMSAAQHDAAAAQEEQTASGHAAQFDPDASVEKRCGPQSGAVLRAGIGETVCWTSMTNATDAHRRAADEHRRHAADHRAGSSSLREAEARACAGVSPTDRDTSPFEHREDITSVAPLTGPDAQLAGAIVGFRAVPGMSTGWLQRAVDCHLARNTSLHNEVPEMPDCPLVPAGATAVVSQAGTGFAVAIRSSDPATAREILARAQRLAAGAPSRQR